MASPVKYGDTQDTRFTPDRQQRFLDLIADAHSLSGAAKLVGINRDTAYDLRDRDPAFATALSLAIKARGDFWEDCLRKLGDRERPDTLGVIIGLKKEGRFVEPQYRQQLNVSIQISDRPLKAYTPEQLKAMLGQMELDEVIEGEIRVLPEVTETPS